MNTTVEAIRRQLAAGMVACGLLIAQLHAAEQYVEPEELETVVVSGEQPGPGLWKVSKGDHVMWVLASYGPLPRNMIWNSKQVEAIVGESQEVIFPGSIRVGTDIGLLRGLTLLPTAMKAGKLPDDTTLKDVLSRETYGEWLVLREKYIGKGAAVEKRRPAFALGELREAAFDKSNLRGGPRVHDVVEHAAKKRKVRIHQLPDIRRTVNVENPRGMLKGVRGLQLSDVACFTRGLDKVESDIEHVKVLANAWSRGDIDKLRSLLRIRQVKETLRENCAYILMADYNEEDSEDAAHAQQMFADMELYLEQGIVQAQQDWVGAAQAALEKNPSTFAVLGVVDVFRPDGHLEKLRALGYSVEEPG